MLQLITANDTATSEDSYLEVIRAKTAALFAAACRIGAVVADRPKVEEEALESYGLNLGIAFQLIDDMLDYSARQEKLGKAIGDDFREGKITLPVILAFRRGNDEERLSGGARSKTWTKRGRPTSARHPIDGKAAKPARYGEAGPPLRRHRPRRAGHLPRQPGQVRPHRYHRFLYRAGLLSRAFPVCDRPLWRYKRRLAGRPGDIAGTFPAAYGV